MIFKMAIEKIKCPVLNLELSLKGVEGDGSNPSGQVLIFLDDRNKNPMKILGCPFFSTGDKKCCAEYRLSQMRGKCLYSLEWSILKEEDE